MLMKAIFSSSDTYLYHIFIDLEEKNWTPGTPSSTPKV